jgi:hypothetical protein
MHAQREGRRGDLIPVIVGAFVAGLLSSLATSARATIHTVVAGQREDDHGRGGVQGRRKRDSVRAARRSAGITVHMTSKSRQSPLAKSNCAARARRVEMLPLHRPGA